MHLVQSFPPRQPLVSQPSPPRKPLGLYNPHNAAQHPSKHARLTTSKEAAPYPPENKPNISPKKLQTHHHNSPNSNHCSLIQDNHNLATQIMRLTAPNSLYIGIGRSPSIIIQCLQQKGKSALTIPLSNFRYGIDACPGPEHQNEWNTLTSLLNRDPAITFPKLIQELKNTDNTKLITFLETARYQKLNENHKFQEWSSVNEWFQHEQNTNFPTVGHMFKPLSSDKEQLIIEHIKRHISTYKFTDFINVYIIDFSMTGDSLFSFTKYFQSYLKSVIKQGSSPQIQPLVISDSEDEIPFKNNQHFVLGRDCKASIKDLKFIKTNFQALAKESQKDSLVSIHDIFDFELFLTIAQDHSCPDNYSAVLERYYDSPLSSSEKCYKSFRNSFTILSDLSQQHQNEVLQNINKIFENTVTSITEPHQILEHLQSLTIKNANNILLPMKDYYDSLIQSELSDLNKENTTV